MRSSFCHPGLLELNSADQLLQALAFRVEHTPAELGQPVIAASGIIQFRRGAFVRFLDEFGLYQAFDRSIEGSGPEAHFSRSAIQDFLHDPVAVLLAIGEREHDMEPLRFKRRKPLRINVTHNSIYSSLYIYWSIVFVFGF